MQNNFTNKLLSDLWNRGFIYQTTNPLAINALFDSNSPVIFYVGFDPTATNLHVGHLLWITLVHKLKKSGHKPIILCGSATAKIGDPTWKNKARVMLNYEIIKNNANLILLSLEKLIGKVKFVDNNDWLSKINYLDFLCDFGRFFSVNKMLAMDSVKERLKRQQHLSFLEFNYAPLQAYDFLHLYENENCVLQIGGADQWSNIVSGVDLIKKIKNKEVFGLTMPLLTNSNGVKMGKTVEGAVWLSPDKTSPFDFWQYWRNVDDRDVCKLLKVFSNMSLTDIEKYESKVGTKDINEAKIKLADCITEFVHSKNEVTTIKKTIQSLFENSGSNNDNLKTFTFYKKITLDQVVHKIGFAQSISKSRKLIEGGAIKINGEQIISIRHQITENCLISSGKKNFANIAIE